MDLITLQEYKDYYSLVKTDADAQISFLISSVSALIQAYINEDFSGGEDVSEIISLDYDTDTIYLSNYPVASIIAITESDRYTYDSTVHVPLVYGSDYILDGPNGVLYRQYTPGGFANWPISPSLVTVEYMTQGTGDGTITSIPADLKLATIQLVKYYKDEGFQQSKSIQGSSIVNGYVQGTRSKETDFPQFIQVILDRYLSIRK